MTYPTNRELPGHEAAIIGHTMTGLPVYDYTLLAVEISRAEGCDVDEAASWIDHNYAGVQNAPIIVQRNEE